MHGGLQKLAYGLSKRGGWGGAQPPPICKHNARMVDCIKGVHMLSSKLAQAGGGGGGATQPALLAKTFCSHAELGGFLKDS